MTLSRKLAKLIIEKNITVEDISATLAKYNLLGLFPAILANVEEIASHTKKGDTLAIESPFPLSDEAITRIKEIVGNDKVTHEVIINKNVLAGFKARFKGKLYDGSAERIIRQLTK